MRPVYSPACAASAAGRLASSCSTLAFLALAGASICPSPTRASETQQASAAGDIPNTVIVTASPLIGNPDRFATIVSRVGREQILKNGGSNLADALSDVPGVTGTNFAAGASRPVIRGFSATRVRILEDGVGSFDVSDVGPDHGVPIDPLAAQSVEVVRGAATLRYGSQAIGGVVNAINNRVPRKLPDEAVSGEVTGSYGTDANTRQGSTLLDTQAGDFAFHADGFYRKTDDYGVPGGTQPNSFFRGSGFSFGSSYFLNDQKSRVGAAIVHYNSKYGIPSDVTYIDMKQTKGLFQSSIDLGGGVFHTLNIDGGYADYTHSEIDPVTGKVAATFKNKAWDSRAETLLGAFGPFTAASFGVQVQHRDFSALGEAANYLLPTTTRSAAGFAFAESRLTKALHLQYGARVERVDISGTPISNLLTKRGFTPVSGSIGVLYDVSDVVKLGLTLSSAARAPAQTELFARGGHDGPGTYEIGDPSLKIERANSLEGTLRIRSDYIRFNGSVWAANFSNYIYGRLTGNTCTDTGLCGPGIGDLREMFYGQHGARFRGVEGKGVVPLYSPVGGGILAGGTLSAEFIGDYVRAKLRGIGNVPRIPPYHVGSGLDWKSDVFDVGFLVKYSGPQNDVSTAETPTRGFINLNANLAVRPFAANRQIEFTIVGHNLTNSVQRDAVSINKDSVVLPGRDVRFTMRVDF